MTIDLRGDIREAAVDGKGLEGHAHAITGRKPLVFVCKVILPYYNLPSENEVSMPVRVRS